MDTYIESDIYCDTINNEVTPLNINDGCTVNNYSENNYKYKYKCKNTEKFFYSTELSG
jgi:hypothetical protein